VDKYVYSQDAERVIAHKWFDELGVIVFKIEHVDISSLVTPASDVVEI
jgi:hypothetical protein